jgi:hypothetical protein
MITFWADEEDKANAKYDAIRGKSKQNAGDNNNNNGPNWVLIASASQTT